MYRSYSQQCMNSLFITVFPVELNLHLQLSFGLERLLYLPDLVLVGAGPVQEPAGAPLLHDVCPE